MKENKNFLELQRYTLEACNIEKFPKGMFIENTNKWLALVGIWDHFLEGGSSGIFEEASHRIMWGVPRMYGKSPYDKIVELVVSEMLQDGDAFNAWDTCDTFDEVVAYMSSESEPNSDYDYRYSIEHCNYLSNRFLWKVKFSKAKYADEKACCEKELLIYETAIKKIVPSALSWNEDYWIDENHILDEIYALYGVDYRHIDCLEYGRILIILMGSEYSGFPSEIVEAWCATNIKTLPFSLAKAIWQNFTEEKILRFFLMAAEKADDQFYDTECVDSYQDEYIHPIEVFEYSAIYKSWMYPLISNWNEDPELYDPFIKERLFTVAINS